MKKSSVESCVKMGRNVIKDIFCHLRIAKSNELLVRENTILKEWEIFAAFYHLRVDGLTLIMFTPSFRTLRLAINSFASFFICSLIRASQHCEKGTSLLVLWGCGIFRNYYESEITNTTVEITFFLDLVISVSIKCRLQTADYRL